MHKTAVLEVLRRNNESQDPCPGIVYFKIFKIRPCLAVYVFKEQGGRLAPCSGEES
jgi:hypothetical protein